MGYKINKNGMGSLDWVIVFVFIAGLLYQCGGGEIPLDNGLRPSF
jgi:hypothetical protein